MNNNDLDVPMTNDCDYVPKEENTGRKANNSQEENGGRIANNDRNAYGWERLRDNNNFHKTQARAVNGNILLYSKRLSYT